MNAFQRIPDPVYFLIIVWDCIVLPCLQTQGTVTAVQLQTDAPVVTASGQQVQTLQVVVSPPPCVSVMTVLRPTSLHATIRAVFHDPSLCCVVHSSLPSMSYSCLNCMILSTVCCVSTSGFRLCSRGCQKTTVCLSCVCLLLLKASFTSHALFFLMRMKAIWNMRNIRASIVQHGSIVITGCHSSSPWCKMAVGSFPLAFFRMVQLLPKAFNCPL